MDYVYPLRKATSLILLLASFPGCETMQSVPGVNYLQDLMPASTSAPSTPEPRSKDDKSKSKDDKYCDAFEEPSYAVTDNVIDILSTTALQTVQDWLQSRFTRLPTGKNDFQKIAENVSKNYVWIPVSAEQTLGNNLQESLEKESKILDRNVRRNRTLYHKVDTALENAKKSYTKLPYEIKLYMVESDQINAEALPAGYIYITRQAANDLDNNALQLVLGHEMAHIAKRHTSKQIQQRLVESGQAAEMLQRIMANRSVQGIDTFFRAERIIESFNGTFAKYDQGQELQADACSIRGMLSAGADPLKAREEYLRKRGTNASPGNPNASPSNPKSKAPKSFALGFTDHPDDKDRDHFFREAYQHHRQKQRVAAQ